jgi:iron complex outermembrane recepter protein
MIFRLGWRRKATRLAGLGCFLFLLLNFPSLAQTPDNNGQACPPPQSTTASDPDKTPAPDSKAGCTQPKLAPVQQTVVVTGTFAPIPAQDIDRSVSVVDTRKDSILYDHWIDYLEQVPSVDLQERGPYGIQADLTIRGSNFEQTLVLLDGLRMNDVQTAHHNMGLPIPDDALKRIEVLRGAGSTFYGSDAVGGTINFITGPPQYSELHLGAGVGNFGINQEEGSAALLTQRFDEQLSVGRQFSDGFMPDRDYRSLVLFSNSDVRTPLGNSLILLGYGDSPFGANDFYGDYPSWERTKVWFAGLVQDLGKKTQFDLAYRRHTDNFILFRDDPAFYANNHIDQSWQAAIRRADPLGRTAMFFYGGEAFQESIVSNNLGNHARSHGAIYVDYDNRAMGRYSLSLGAREEIFDSGQTEFSPTVAAGMWLKHGWKLIGSASRAFRLPTYTDLYYSDPTTIGNPNLLPETAWSYEGGFVWNQGGRANAQIVVFERREKNDIDYVRASPADQWHAENIARVNFTGVETFVQFRLPHQQQLEVAYTGIYGAQSGLDGLQSEYVFNYPVNDAFVLWQGKLPGKLIARGRLGAVQRYDRDAYALLEAAVGRDFRYLAAHLSCSNLTNTGYEEIPGVPMPGRTVIFGMDLYLRNRAR